MKQSLRKTPSPLHLAYRYGDESDHLVGRNIALDVDGAVLTLSIDLAANFQARDKSRAAGAEAEHLAQNHHRLQTLRCGDNLVRSRLIRAWEQVDRPQLRMCLDLGERGRFLYSVQPHSLLAGGIQLDVEQVLAEDAAAGRPLSDDEPATPRSHP